ncbi:MAG: acetyl-CoA carboxylase biotin carboxyl carrier protein subunit [Anaerolineaceae bacterium]|nr:acetyl-CoA carboxylase biotin carboxyl carrier protein subunit [Anaerolineaceae bacterium]
MTRYIVTIDQEEYIVEITEKGIFINGVMVEDSFLSPLNDQGLYLIQTGMEKQEIHIQHENKNEYKITVDGHYLSAQIERDNGRKKREPAKNKLHNGEITAPMAAVLIDMPISSGDIVEEGQTLLVLEAMKMQMKIKAPADGTVISINKQAGDRVEKGDLMVKLDIPKD